MVGGLFFNLGCSFRAFTGLLGLLVLCVLIGLPTNSYAKKDDPDDALVAQCQSQRASCDASCSGKSGGDKDTCQDNCKDAAKQCYTNGSSAGVDDSLSGTLCEVIKLLLGRTGRVIATIGIFFGGVAVFLGSMKWGTALVICLSITGMFGAIDIVKWFTGYTACEGVVMPNKGARPELGGTTPPQGTEP